MLSYKGKYELMHNISCIKCKAPFSFSKNTTYGVGGYADIAYFPQNITELKCLYDVIVANKKPYVVLGNGSNVLASDEGYSGVVISTRLLKGIVRIGSDKIFCLAGTTISQILKYCKINNLSGLEYMYGIPATVGGAAFMNAGVSNYYIGNNIVNVRLYTGKTVILNNKQCNFGYKRSTMRDINAIISGVTLRLEMASCSVIDEKIDFFKQKRRHLPAGRSCGCVFKNPEGISAGELIERAGLKRARIGGAFVSGEHANFILCSSARSSDVFRLISFIKAKVYQQFKVILQEEVVYIGEFNDTYG